MHKKLKVIMLAFMSALLAKAAVTMQTASARIETAGKKLLIKNRLPEPQWSRAELLFSLYEGKEKKTVKMPMPYVSQKDAVMEIEFKGKGWNWQNRVQVKNRLFLIEAKLLNTGKKQLWLEPGLRVIPQFSQSPTEFWDGSGKIRAVGDEELERNGAYSRTGSQTTAPGKRGYGSEAFPAAAIIGGDQALFLGYVPFDPVSYSATSWKPEGGVFSYSQRIVADPGQHVEFRQVLGVAAVAFGGAEGVIQQYYDSFPECWQLSGEQENPYIWGNHAHYQHWWSSPDAERSRRLRYSIDWSYCPYKRSGDMRMRPELWDYETFNPFDSWPTPKYAGVRSHFPKTNWQEQTALRRERFHKFAGKLGWMFYNSGTASWCEYQLAEERYADAIIQEGGKPVAKNRWSTGHDREYQMFPYHSSFAKASEEDMRFLAADLQLPGFAFDCGSGGSAYRGPNVNKPCPGRAWDEEGVFIDNLVAKNHQADVVRAINPEQPLTIFMNGTLKGDYVMFERPYVNTADYRVMMPLFRWWAGPRPGCVHGHGYLFRDTVPNWRNMSKQEFADLMSRLADYTLLNQFKYGLTNSYVTMYGNPQLVYILPEALELMRAKWQVEVPLRLSAGLYAPYKALYGRGENAFVYLANSSAQTSSGQVYVDNEALTGNAGRRQLFIRKLRHRASGRNHIEGKLTSFKVELPSRTPVIFETVCGIENAPENLTAELSSEKNLAWQIFTVNLAAAESFQTGLRLRKIRDFHLQSLSINGQQLDFTREEASYKVARLDFDAESKMEIRYHSKQFYLEDALMDNFPFVNKQKKLSFVLVLPRDDVALRRLARRFNEYFKFCADKGLLEGDYLVPLSTETDSIGEANTVSLQIVPGAQARISAGDRGGILLTAGSENKSLVNAQALPKVRFGREDNWENIESALCFKGKR